MFHAEQFDFEFMKERPILFNGEMVRALLDGRKSQTRRVLKPQPNNPRKTFDEGIWAEDKPRESVTRYFSCPYGQPGDRITVKEAAWMWCERKPNGKTKTGRDKWLYVPMRAAQVFYCADHPEKPALDVVSPDTGNKWGWRKKIGRFLPRWASRITLEVVNVRVERVQSITADDSLAEGITKRPRKAAFPWHVYAPDDYKALWNSINSPRGFGWDVNPWVWVVEFKRVEAGK